MKFSIPFLLLAVSAWSQQPAVQQDVAQANAQQARQVIDKCIQALGGSAYLKMVGSEQHGRGFGFYRNAPTGIGILYVRMYRYPDKERYEFTKKRDWIIIHNGDNGYETTFRGTQAENATDLATYQRRRKYALDYVLRDWINKPGVAFFYDGVTITGPKTVHKVTIMNAADEGITLFIDTSSFLPVKKSYTWRDEKYKEMNTEEELYDEYRIEQGINTPHVITRIYNGEMQSQRFITTVTYDPGLSDALFTPPTTIYNKMKK